MIADYNEININDYRNDILNREEIEHDLKINPFGKYLLYIEKDEIVGYI